MAKKTKKEQPQTVTINDTEYSLEDLTDSQIKLVQQVSDLDRKIGTSKFTLDQLSVGREAFMSMLTESLEAEEEKVA
jgi:hypothetical protein